MLSAHALVPRGLNHMEEMQWMADHILRNGPRNNLFTFAVTGLAKDSETAKFRDINEIPEVVKAIQTFLDDCEEENAIAMIRQIIKTDEAMRVPPKPTIIIRTESECPPK